MTRTTLLSLYALLCAIAPATLLAGPVTSAQQTGYLQDYHRLYHVGGVPIEQMWVDPELNLLNYRTLYIAPVQIDPAAYYRNGLRDQAIAAHISEKMQASLLSSLQAAGIFKFVSSDPFFSAPRREALKLEVRITEIYSGDPDKRYRTGFGSGATQIQIEGKLIEIRSCRTLLEFADRRIHPGDALIIGKEKSADSEYLLTLDSLGIFRGIVKMFVYLREEGPILDIR